MDHFTSTETAQPWWADVAHLRDDAPASVLHEVTAPSAADAFSIPATDRPGRPTRATPTLGARHDRPARPASSLRDREARPSGRGRTRAPRPAADWFADEAGTAGRRTAPRLDPSAPARPRVTLVDVSPEHAVVTRAPQTRRAPGERPTVTITGRPDAALPPRVAEPSARRPHERASSLLASPDRMILWAVALGLLMILASIGTASADAATTLTLLP